MHSSNTFSNSHVHPCSFPAHWQALASLWPPERAWGASTHYHTFDGSTDSSAWQNLTCGIMWLKLSLKQTANGIDLRALNNNIEHSCIVPHPCLITWKATIPFFFGQTALTIFLSLRLWSSGATCVRVATAFYGLFSTKCKKKRFCYGQDCNVLLIWPFILVITTKKNWSLRLFPIMTRTLCVFGFPGNHTSVHRHTASDGRSLHIQETPYRPWACTLWRTWAEWNLGKHLNESNPAKTVLALTTGNTKTVPQQIKSNTMQMIIWIISIESEMSFWQMSSHVYQDSRYIYI